MKNLTTLIISLFFTSVSFATTINIPADYSTIQAGINETVDGDTVLVQPGAYIENINFNGKNITVASMYLTTQDTSYISQTIIDGNQSGSVVKFMNGENLTATLLGFTIKNGLGNSISGNASGGITTLSSSPSLKNLKIIDNFSSSNGGGIYCSYSSSPYIINVEISSNNAPNRGGGIYCSAYSNPILENVIIINNTAYEGGGMFLGLANSTITNSTIFGNTASVDGGGIYCFEASVSLSNSILWNDSPQEVYVGSGSVNIFYSDIQGGWTGEGNINLDPLFVDAATGDYHLTANSPCIDAGISFFVFEGDTLVDMSEDEYVGSAPDMGAFEYGALGGVDDDFSDVPNEFTLLQNYPNPFNPVTTLRYDLPENSHVNIMIYDIMGREVRSLVNNQQNAGFKSVLWDATNESGQPVSAGIYFYRISAGDFHSVKKMILLK